jgi:hypothetical protein
MKLRGSGEGPSVGSPSVVAGRRERTVTRRQVDQAVAQLRERHHLPAAEQMRAVLRALDLVVVPDPEIPGPREAPGVDPGHRRPDAGC